MNNFKKLLAILLPNEKRKLPLILGMMMVATFLEVLGVGLVVPLTAVLVQPALLQTNPWASSVLRRMGDPDQRSLLTLGLAAIGAVYFLKAIFLTFQCERQTRFINDVQLRLSQRLFSTYLRQPYTFHLQRNSAQLIRSTFSDVGHFTGKCLVPGMLISTELISFTGIGLLLFFASPTATMTVLVVVGILAAVFFLQTRERILRWGRERMHHDGLRIQHLQQGLSGAKEIKLLGREELFIDRFSEHSRAFERVSRRESLMQQMPRFWIELFGVVGIVLLVVVLVSQDRDVASIVPLLGLFGAAAFRLMPSVNRIVTAFQEFRFGTAVLSSLVDELGLPQEKPLDALVPERPLARAICLEHVTFRYNNSVRDALRDVTLVIEKGDTVGFVGPSGAGKSTLVDVVLGLLTPTQGRILVDGQNIADNLRSWQRQIGYVQQSVYLTDDTLRRNIAFGLRDKDIDDDAVRLALASAQLIAFVETLPNGVDTEVGERGVRLSGGQRQRIAIARALYHDPGILVLDEATSALDTVTEREVMAAVEALHGEKTVLIIAHRMSTLSGCDHVYRLVDGCLAPDIVP